MSVADDTLGELAIAESRDPYGGVVPSAVFDWFSTLISQYANSPVLLQLVANMAEYIDPTALFDKFFQLVFNVDTAIGYGLDVWGRIVGVSRVLQLPLDGKYLGFEQADPTAYSFGEGIFFSNNQLTSNFALADEAYRRLILAKALANISDGSIPAINQILINLFGAYGNCYVTDGEDMTMTYTFGSALTPVDFAIVSQSGVLPRPVGVSVTVVEL